MVRNIKKGEEIKKKEKKNLRRADLRNTEVESLRIGRRPSNIVERQWGLQGIGRQTAWEMPNESSQRVK